MHRTNLLVFVLSCSVLLARAQMPTNTIPETREIVLNVGDTIQKMRIFVTNPSLRAKANYFYAWYQKQRILYTEGSWSGKLLQGPYESFYPNHNLLEQGKYQHGWKVGIWKRWYPDGTLHTQTEWKQGRLHGTFQRFDASGQLIEQGTHRQGKLHGALTTFQGDQPTKVRYRNGALVEAKAPKKKPKKKAKPPKKEKPQKSPAKKEKTKPTKKSPPQ